MYLVNRFDKIRGLYPVQRYLSPPYVLGRLKSGVKLEPYNRREWLEYKRSLIRIPQGGIGSRFAQFPYTGLSGFISSDWGTGVTTQTKALDSAYTAGSAGDAVGARMLLTAAQTVAGVHTYITSYTGTAANVNDLNMELRTGTISAPDLTGPGLVTSASVNPASATGWISFTGLSQLLAVNTWYYPIIGDADGNGTDFATLIYSATGSAGGMPHETMWHSVCSTSNGWSTTSFASDVGSTIVEMSDGTARGQPFLSQPSITNDTDDKGLRFEWFGPAMKIFGMSSDINLSIHNIDLYANGVNPGGGTLATGAIPISLGSAAGGCLLSSGYTLTPGDVYRLVFRQNSGNLNSPRPTSVGASAPAGVKKAMLGNGAWYYTEENAGAWTDTDYYMPLVVLFIDDAVQSSGGGALVGPNNLVGI